MCNWKLKQSQKLINLGIFYFTGLVANRVARETFSCIFMPISYFSGRLKITTNL